MRESIKLSRDIFAQSAFDPYRDVELQPGEGVVTDDQIDAFARANSDSSYHPSCTCKMGNPAKNDTVVDSDTMQVVGKNPSVALRLQWTHDSQRDFCSISVKAWTGFTWWTRLSCPALSAATLTLRRS